MSSLDVVTFKGALLVGPPKASTGGFPPGMVNTTFDLKPAAKSAPVSTFQKPSVSSPSSYAALDGIGTGSTVTKANFLYLRTDAPFLLRITFDDGAGGNVVVTGIPVDGLFVQETQANKFIKLLEAQGTGVVEYFASGNQ